MELLFLVIVSVAAVGAEVELYRECTESEFQCPNKKCIPTRWRCDQYDDCDDGSDEQDCSNYECPADQFKCDSGHCIASKLKCDGNKDCSDVSDEIGCPPRLPDGKYCPDNVFQCNNTVCIRRDFLCDGDDDCGDMSDEKPEDCLSEISCDPVHKFQCPNDRCIPIWQVCNGQDDCGDGSDERGCQCMAPPATIRCDEPLTQMQITGFKSSAPLFADADISAICEVKPSNFLLEISTMEFYVPFSGKMLCNSREIITGLEICFQVELTFIGLNCTPLEAGYYLDIDNVQVTSNSRQKPEEISCPDDMAFVSLELEQDDEGNILVIGECAKVLEGEQV